MRDPITGRFLATEDALRQHSIEIFTMSAADFLGAWRCADGTWMAHLLEERVNEQADPDLDDPEYTAERERVATENAAQLAGWYWWTCVPGCLPDSDAFGPFPTERKAAANALGDLE